MSNSKATRSALFASATALLLCVVLLIGTTFAWFSDSATTKVNDVMAGTLDVALLDASGNELVGEPLAWQKSGDAPAGETVLWEPGCTYTLQPVTIKNNGDLALKYSIILSGINGSDELNDVIDWTFKIGNTEYDETTIKTYEGKLTAGKSDTLTISGHMHEDAGNEYMGEKISSIAITVIAGQDTVEYDSTGNNYDTGALYPPTSPEELATALENGGLVILGSDIAVVPEGEGDYLIPQMTITKDTTIDLLNNTLGVDPSVYEQSLSYTPVLISVDSGTLTINGDGTVSAEAGNNNSYGIDVNGGSLVINGGSYYGALTAVQVEKGSLVINGGFFDLAPTCKAAVPQYAKYVVNCIDSAFKNGTATISITGGTFVNFDPSANPEGAGTSYVAEGYTVVSETKDSGEIWYTVVPE